MREEIEKLFKINWQLLKKDKIKSIITSTKGSYRNKKDGDDILRLFKDGWDTKIELGIKIYKDNLIKESSYRFK